MYIADMNILYDAYRASMKGSSWKREPQKFEHNWLEELSALKKELETETYKTSKGTEFVLNERGKTRYIHGVRMRDRVVRHALCDCVLNPCFKPYLIPNNGASQKGKGLSYARLQFEKDLHNYYLEHGSTDGWIVFLDLSKFFDNIRHDEIKKHAYPKIPQDTWWLLDHILSTFEIDVSYMNDEIFSHCLDIKFDSVEYNLKRYPKTGEKMMKKSVNIGDQVSQDLGVFMPYRIDNYVKTVCGIKHYGRYMDDVYFIVESKVKALSVIDGVKRNASEMKLYLNDNKTRIVKINSSYKFLQIKYSCTKTGKVTKRINPVTLNREKRKLKRYKSLLDKNEISKEDIEQCYKSWMGSYYKLMSKKQIKSVKGLYYKLFGKDVIWKKQK